ncbi:MAG: hypothetical protein DWQ10_10015 [Calditrichaeota bacterium]|nr:MAG: hypothetical protein DWQ10_10015 [Calditrichota bacterium]
MRKFILMILLVSPSIGHASVMKSYRLVWDTGKIASFGFGLGYNFFNVYPAAEQLDSLGQRNHPINKNVFGPVIDAEAGITGYEYSAGVKFGKSQNLNRNTYLITFFAGRSQNLIDLKSNLEKNHFVLGVRLNRKFTEWAIKFHTDFETNRIITIQFGLGE